MLNKIISFSIKNKLVVGLFTIALILYGIFELTKLPIDAVPDITNNQVQVITVAPSFGATDIERLVTFPIEQANNNLPGLIEIRSFSRFGLSLVTIVFDDATDVYWARQQVSERLQKIKDLIPKGIGTPELAPVTTGLGEIYQYVVRPKKGYEGKYDATELRTIQDWIVRRQLLGVKGVAEVSSFGGKLKQYEIAINTDKLNAQHITISDVFNALEKNNDNTGGAYIEKGPTVLYIRTEGLIASLDDINNIAIKTTQDGTPLFIKDVADVRIGHATRFGALCYNDKGEVAGAVVMMLKGANSNKVIESVKSKIEQIQTTLPEGVIIEPFLDRTKMVNNAIGTVQTNLMEGALIVIFILVLFLGNFRAGLLVASVIPLAMLFAIIMMNIFGVSGNLMSLGALDFGLIVDGAVIIVEAVMHQLHHGKKLSITNKINQEEMDKTVNLSAGKMMNSAVFGQIIILVVYLPIFTLQGIEGKMFKPMAQTVAFALVGAFILSLTYIPMMSAVFLSKKLNHKKTLSDRIMEKIESAYNSVLSKLISIPKTVITSVIILFSLSILTLLSLGGEFIPALEEGDFAVETRVLTGSNLNTSIENTQKASKILLKQFPEVEKVVTKIGSGEVPTDPMPMDAADLMVILKDKKEWTSAHSFNDLAEKMNTALSEIPGVTFSFQFPVQMRFNELMTGAKQDVVCKIFGEDLDTLAAYANKLGKIINTVEGAKDIYVEAVTGMPQVVIQYKRNAMAQYNLNIGDVNKVINAAFAGQIAGLVFEGEKRFDLAVRLKNDNREDLNDIKNLLIPVSNGNQIPLEQIAQVEIKNGPNQIQREDAKRRIVVGFNVRGRDVQSIVNELQDKVGKQIKFPAGYYPTYGGAFENLNEAKNRLAIAVPISLILIFLLLYFAFNSIKQGLLIYTAIPLSAIGGIFALFLRGMPFSISAGIGFIALFGVAVLNGIVLIAEFNRLKESGHKNIIRIILIGTKVRLRPILMTAFVASLGFLPMALSNGAGAEVQRPLATVVIGGLLIATFLTLFVLPILYIMFERKNSVRLLNYKALTSIVFTSFIFLSNSLSSQQSISLQAAIELGLKNNLLVKNEKLKSDYQKQLVKSGFNLPSTTVNGEYGQINSSYYDNRVSVSQSLNFPTVYARQKSVLNEEWKSSLLSVSLKEAELKRNISLLYYNLIVLEKKAQLLKTTDSIYANYSILADLKFAKGDNNILEKTAAESQRGQIMIQLNQLQQEIDLLQLEFQLLLNTPTKFILENSQFKVETVISPDTTLLKQHPLIKQLEQQTHVFKLNTKLERSKLLPDLNFSYNNMSMIGTGSDNVLYNSSTRFQSVQAGLGIPLFFGAQKAKIKSAKSMYQISENNYQSGIQNIRNEYKKASAALNNQLNSLSYFESKALKNADLISETATKQFNNGEINYMEWVLLLNQSVSIKNDYLNTIKNYNEAALQLNYLLSK